MNHYHHIRTITALALTFAFSQAAFAEEPCWCWFDSKTGKKVRTVPAGGAEVDFSDENSAFNPANGRNYFRAPCPPPAATTPPPPKKEEPKTRDQTGTFYRTGEVEMIAYGLGGTGHGEHNVTETHTETRKATIFETQTVQVDVPGTPGLVARDVTTEREVKVKHTERHTRNVAPLQGGFGGAGAEAKVFVTRNVGLGLEGDWLDGESSLGTVMGTVTARFPTGSNAPYVFGGAGVQFGDRTQAVGKLGAGIEHRFSPNTGVFVDASWMFADHENAAVFRAGISLVR